jgi:hypothetical protein
MPRRPKRHLVPVLALIALVFLVPALTTAAPRQGEDVRAPAERHEAAPSLFAQLQSLLSSFLWKNGSGLDPNGAKPGPSAGSGIMPTGDNGSILEPNG